MFGKEGISVITLVRTRNISHGATSVLIHAIFHYAHNINPKAIYVFHHVTVQTIIITKNWEYVKKHVLPYL